MGESTPYRFTLYITGWTGRAERVERGLRSICDALLLDMYSLDVVDLLDHPHLAKSEGILSTPRLVKEAPFPRRHAAGDLCGKDTLIESLGLPQAGHGGQES